jgi:hypothetical protein
MASDGVEGGANDTSTRVTKKVTMPVTTPISGVMATSGTERRTMAMGMRVCPTSRHRVTATATGPGLVWWVRHSA